MNKVGLITFHASHNCGSMMQTYALQTVIQKLGRECEVINFSNEGQRMLYSPVFPNSSLKNIVKNIILWPHRKRIKRNYNSYEEFKNKNFNLSSGYFSTMDQLSDRNYDVVIAGSDQIWNITIEDGDDAYFLPWVEHAKKVAYAPSFGAKSLQKYAKDLKRYEQFINDFDMLSIRELNGQKWLKSLIGQDVPVLLDPTLLLDAEDYDKIAMHSLNLPEHYIFYYAPGYSNDINALVKKVSEKYSLPVIAFNTRAFYVKRIQRLGFTLPEIENPAAYLQLIKNASIVFTTSFHGTVFSSIYRKAFWTIKNGGMLGDDDRVKTLMVQLGLEDRLIPIEFDEDRNYLSVPDYIQYNKSLSKLRKKSNLYLNQAILG